MRIVFFFKDFFFVRAVFSKEIPLYGVLLIGTWQFREKRRKMVFMVSLFKYSICQYYLDVRICENFVYFDVNIDGIRPQKVNEYASERLTKKYESLLV